MKTAALGNPSLKVGLVEHNVRAVKRIPRHFYDVTIQRQHLICDIKSFIEQNRRK